MIYPIEVTKTISLTVYVEADNPYVATNEGLELAEGTPLNQWAEAVWGIEACICQDPIELSELPKGQPYWTGGYDGEFLRA